MPAKTVTETKHDKEFYLAAFEDFERTVADSDPPWLRPIRNAAIARFAELGFPGPQVAVWPPVPRFACACIPSPRQMNA